MKKVKRTERGWAGHFICADRCLFRRNTLLEYRYIKIVVSTVGRMVNIHGVGYPNKLTFERIGNERFFETMAFHSNKKDTRYYDINVHQQIYFDSPWAINEIDADDKANDMHEVVVDEITKGLLAGNKYEVEA